MSLISKTTTALPDFFKKIIKSNENLAKQLVEEATTNKCIILDNKNTDLIYQIIDILNARKDVDSLTEFGRLSISDMIDKLSVVYTSLHSESYLKRYAVRLYYRDSLENSYIYLLEVTDSQNKNSYIATHGRFGGHYACKYGSQYVVV